ncbi:MAG TPA: PfkB family carbohydrate kinase [Baekduia sp.]|uniref:PfkB family carbohydrate kinase n=1 Tax=Baekduia sp. TaxID=2600305 RepID=UPI002C1DBA6A|nr:PfkB family carbohydrate kinase [Baekduia sp.]HMJ37690.1 PfkB family carbohydrate kinase [Baekduia sp.]
MIEALVTGRVALDLYPEQSRRALEDVETFRQYAGGFAANVATGLARLGVRTAVFSAVGDDGHGRHIRNFLEGEGVDCGWVATDPQRRTALAFCEIWPPDDFPITYHRTPTCPDWEVTLQDAGVDLQVAAAVPLLYLSGTALARAASLEAMVALAGLRAGGPHHTILDLDWRPMLWASAEDFAARVQRVLPAATVVLGGDKEWAAAGLDPAAPSSAVRVAKHGPDGCSVHRPDGSHEDVAPIPVAAINGLGAGDAFAAGWGYSLLRGLDQPAHAANAAGAIVATRHSCSAAMPSREELESFLRSGVLPGPAPAGAR